jgi:hypothetical protein
MQDLWQPGSGRLARVNISGVSNRVGAETDWVILAFEAVSEKFWGPRIWTLEFGIWNLEYTVGELSEPGPNTRSLAGSHNFNAHAHES